MRKEIYLAILAGAIFGLIIAFGIWRANSSLRPSDTSSQIAETPASSSETQFGLTIAKPEENSVLTENSVTLSGITKPSAWVVISAEEEDYVIEADAKGGFEKNIGLIGGINEIIVTSFDKSGNSNTQKVLAVYSSEFK